MIARRVAVALLVSFLAMVCDVALANGSQRLASPHALVEADVTVTPLGQLSLSVLRGGQPVVGPCRLGIVVEGVDLGKNVALGKATSRKIEEEYATRGVKSRATNAAIAYELPVSMEGAGKNWTLEVRVFDDGVAFRYRVPGSGSRRVNGETTQWQLPGDATVWVQHNTSSYEGDYRSYQADGLTSGGDGKPVYIGCPLTAELPQGGYALITEACLYNYSGMTLQAIGDARLQAVFQDDSRGWTQEGEILSPWRVTVVVDDLNALVNSDLIFNLGESPDPKLFPEGADTPWIKPGKGLITWAVFMNDGAQWYRQKWFVDMCAAMGCEYLLVDGGWRTEKWGFLRDGGDLWQRLTELCAYGKSRGVAIFVWHAYPEGRDDGPGLTEPETRREFFQKCKAAGVAGVKIDFFNSERKEVVQAYGDILRETAELQLMVNFHGANKPTGEVRSWPHEISREGIREQEYLLFARELPLPHYGALPFSRMVAGHGDFLPTYVRPKFLINTTAVFQLGTSIIFTSPFICWPDHPEAYLDSPFLHLIRSMPPVWDETRVLEGSQIGKRVAFARRSGEDWYVAVLNCQDEPVSFELDDSFLGDGEYLAMCYSDGTTSRAAVESQTGQLVRRGQKRRVTMQPGGGFVARYSRPREFSK